MVYKRTVNGIDFAWDSETDKVYRKVGLKYKRIYVTRHNALAFTIRFGKIRGMQLAHIRQSMIKSSSP